MAVQQQSQSCWTGVYQGHTCSRWVGAELRGSRERAEASQTRSNSCSSKVDTQLRTAAPLVSLLEAVKSSRCFCCLCLTCCSSSGSRSGGNAATDCRHTIGLTRAFAPLRATEACRACRACCTVLRFLAKWCLCCAEWASSVAHRQSADARTLLRTTTVQPSSPIACCRAASAAAAAASCASIHSSSCVCMGRGGKRVMVLMALMSRGGK